MSYSKLNELYNYNYGEAVTNDILDGMKADPDLNFDALADYYNTATATFDHKAFADYYYDIMRDYIEFETGFGYSDAAISIGMHWNQLLDAVDSGVMEEISSDPCENDVAIRLYEYPNAWYTAMDTLERRLQIAQIKVSRLEMVHAVNKVMADNDDSLDNYVNKNTGQFDRDGMRTKYYDAILCQAKDTPIDDDSTDFFTETEPDGTNVRWNVLAKAAALTNRFAWITMEFVPEVTFFEMLWNDVMDLAEAKVYGRAMHFRDEEYETRVR